MLSKIYIEENLYIEDIYFVLLTLQN